MAQSSDEPGSPRGTWVRREREEKETPADEGKSDTDGKGSCLDGWISLWDKRRGHLMR